jgi:SAM-dependent methyltransferase
MNATAARQVPQPEWFASWFDSAHYHKLYAHRDAREAAAFIDQLIDRRQIEAGAAVLDLGCGAGRHATHLASKGFDVTGIDLSAKSLEQARPHESSRLRFVRQDMRCPFGTNAFDCVLSLFTSFGYFDDPADNVTVVHNVARALKPGGRVVLDYLNSRQAETRLTPEEVTACDVVVYRLSRWIDRDNIFKRVVIDDPGAGVPAEYVERVAKLTLEEFRFMFAVCDLRIDATYGDYQLSPFDLETSPRLIIVAKKTACWFDEQLPSREVLANAAHGLRRHPEIGRKHRLWNA